jgi:hypothetical protein
MPISFHSIRSLCAADHSLFCKNNGVFFLGDVHGGDGGSGDHAVFLLGGNYVKVDQIDATMFPSP